MPPQPHLKQILEARSTLTREQARDLMQQILSGQLTDLEIAALLGALAARGETASEIAGFVDVMRTAVTPIPLTDAERKNLVDTCGTGGDASGTFNISTAAALVAAATPDANLMVAKHGNRAITSQTGSADVLEALGIPVDLTPDQAATTLRTHHFAFLHAPSLHPAMKAVMPVRRALGVRTVFNILGPLTNPAGASAQVMGVYSAHLVPIVAEAMCLLGTHHAFVVHGSTLREKGPAGSPDGSLDEISISGPTQLAEVHHGAITIATITPEDLGLQRSPIETLQGGDAQTNAAILTAIFSGEQGPRRDIVLLNAAAVLVAADLALDLPNGIALAAKNIDSGAVTRLIANLRT
ncbi:anthranilate phosphoribosyltransferase [Tunturibacter empetritectus]|uniref:Anthranilate phosphoribosyltransferase n=1 Tax=Tunturiibacter empetritectus TaxID=3069691 RepID=A0A7W8IIA1_9BACT|nr:anthranilate phosphoribosyltransferase [Edaphobacter lichenicola]MBB5316836.1 anthranilate phosphoribosyltransferase [Edaphobacter lichenicola]